MLKIKSVFFYVIRTLGVTGTLRTNGKVRDNRVFHKLSCYITQEDLIQPLLTVQEIMMVAARLKLPSHTSEKHRLNTVVIIIMIIIIIIIQRIIIIIQHIIAACEQLASTEYVKRHDSVEKVIH
jgi:hypothetical protein